MQPVSDYGYRPSPLSLRCRQKTRINIGNKPSPMNPRDKLKFQQFPNDFVATFRLAKNTPYLYFVHHSKQFRDDVIWGQRVCRTIQKLPN